MGNEATSLLRTVTARAADGLIAADRNVGKRAANLAQSETAGCTRSTRTTAAGLCIDAGMKALATVNPDNYVRVAYIRAERLRGRSPSTAGGACDDGDACTSMASKP